MAAANTDKFRKKESNFSTTLASSITDADTTIALSSATGLPTDTAITLTIDRVDANSVSTPAKVERVTGVISGNNLTNALRGEDGTTAAAHDSAAVVEDIWDGETWNDTVDGILVEHSQSGAHSPKLTFYSTNFFAPEGFLLNGKIVPSVALNNLTVAIKGNDGNDPSATNPVYCMIGGTLRSITAALSVTKNAGTNWCNAGGAELATKEIDYFVYLGYNTTDGVVIGFSRISHGTIYSDFSATTTNEKYAGISTITNAAAGNPYTNIGRFAATLSAGAGYTWTVPTFTAANLIQRPIYETRKLVCEFQFTASGGGSFTPALRQTSYRLMGRRCFIYFNTNAHTISGTVNSLETTLPFLNVDETASGFEYGVIGFSQTSTQVLKGQTMTTGISIAPTTGAFAPVSSAGYMGVKLDYII